MNIEIDETPTAAELLQAALFGAALASRSFRSKLDPKWFGRREYSAALAELHELTGETRSFRYLQELLRERMGVVWAGTTKNKPLEAMRDRAQLDAETHQALNRLGTVLRLCGSSDDGSRMRLIDELAEVGRDRCRAQAHPMYETLDNGKAEK